MRRYRGADEGSGVEAYESGPGWIRVRFRGGAVYHYDHRHPGAAHVLEMQRLADAGSGLAGYISRYVRGDYAARSDQGHATGGE